MVDRIEIYGRDGKRRNFNEDEIIRRIYGFIKGGGSAHRNLNGIDIPLLVEKIKAQLPSRVMTTEIDMISAKIAHGMIVQNPDYDILASRIFMDNLHKMTPSRFSHAMNKLQNNINPDTEAISPLLNPTAASFIIQNSFALDNMIDSNADFNYPYSGMCILYGKYLTSIYDGTKDERGKYVRVVIEHPQYVWMRVAIMASHYNIDTVGMYYNVLSARKLSVATPIANNSCRINEYMSSCFLVEIDDSIDDIYGKLRTCAHLSKFGGGVGQSFDRVRPRGSYIAGTHGISNGTGPFMNNMGQMFGAVDQGGNNRSGSCAMYMSVFHPDFPEFIQMQTSGNDVTISSDAGGVIKNRDIFLGMWIPDLFIERVRANGVWSFFDPTVCPLLYKTFDNRRTGSKKFTRVYENYEAEGKYVRQIKAVTLFTSMITIMMETTKLYFCSKDGANSASNQVDIDETNIIKLSNLCSEIYQLTSTKDISNCNLASLILPQFVTEDGEFDTEEIMRVSGIATNLLNTVIDRNDYIGPVTRDNNMYYRPIAIGIQGLCNALLKIKGYKMFTKSSRHITLVAEAIYLGALRASAMAASEEGPYLGYNSKCLYYNNIFAPDMYPDGAKLCQLPEIWKEVRALVREHGLRNSLLTAWMPTAQTSMVNNCGQGGEPFLNKRFSKKTSIGDVNIVISEFIYEMMARGLWNTQAIKEFNECRLISQMECVPKDMKEKYLSAYEMDQRKLIDIYANAQRFIDQGISMNRYGITGVLTGEDLANQIIYAVDRGLKTAIYYCRLIQLNERPMDYTNEAKSWMNNPEIIVSQIVDNISNLNINQINEKKSPTEEEIAICSRENRESCEMCSA